MKTHTPIPQAAPKIIVRSLSARSATGVLTYGSLSFPCALGRSGRLAGKREGDGATPIGTFALREAFYRPDRLMRPRTQLPISPIDVSDGWCDAPEDRNYNRPIQHPYAARAEHMWRSDGLYDVVIVMGHNDQPRIAGRGSAVFMHVAGPGLKPTEGCIALARPHLIRLLQAISPDTCVSVTA
jgi:L,D-peptidoglycan transpeptidase YkuD (ErfK/YbiS/YcfS/YnhG family)